MNKLPIYQTFNLIPNKDFIAVLVTAITLHYNYFPSTVIDWNSLDSTIEIVGSYSVFKNNLFF